MADSGDVATFLPVSIKEALKRKSSRDPSSRFPTKLHMLLQYVNDNPDEAERVGVEWLPNNEFRMNKAILSDVMGIKVNTLNVNLRDRNFTQLQRDKGGWTKWKREGFTKDSLGAEYESEASHAPQRRTDHMLSSMNVLDTSMYMQPVCMFPLGQLSRDEQLDFARKAQETWYAITGGRQPTTSLEDPESLIEKIAMRFRYMEQPLDNAKAVIRAIIEPSPVPALGYAEFCRLLAMFGPEETIMLKISSLLNCSNNTGKWLTFDANQSHTLPSAVFDPKEPNCLVVQKRDRTTMKVYNHPLIEVNPIETNSYVIDQDKKQYSSWEAFFQQHPVNVDSHSFSNQFY